MSARTVLDLVRAATDYLTRQGVETSRLDAEVLLADLLGVRRLDLYVRFDMPLDETAKNAFRERLMQRGKGRPVSHIVGYREFYGRRFAVGPAVLTPRPETELLIDEALAFLKSRRRSDPAAPAPRVLELGVGSGAVLATMAAEIGEGRFVGVEISPEAIVVARKNIAAAAPTADVDVRAGDLFAPVRDEAPFDLIVPNPPYVTDAEWSTLTKDVREFDPALALRSGEDPVAFHRRILSGAEGLLSEKGRIVLEGGSGLPEFLAEAARSSPNLRGRLVRDLADLPRILVFDRPSAGLEGA